MLRIDAASREPIAQQRVVRRVEMDDGGRSRLPRFAIDVRSRAPMIGPAPGHFHAAEVRSRR